MRNLNTRLVLTEHEIKMPLISGNLLRKRLIYKSVVSVKTTHQSMSTKFIMKMAVSSLPRSRRKSIVIMVVRLWSAIVVHWPWAHPRVVRSGSGHSHRLVPTRTIRLKVSLSLLWYLLVNQKNLKIDISLILCQWNINF